MKKGYLYILATTVFFSSMEISLKHLGGAFDPIQITCMRFLIGGLILLPFALRTLRSRGAKLRVRDFLAFAGLGFLCVVVSMTLFQLAVQNANASVVAALISSNPVFVALFAFFLLREPLTRYNIAALIFSVVGIVIIINPLTARVSVLGVVFALLSTVFFALYGALGTRKSIKFGGIASTSFSFLFGAVEMLVLVGLGHIPAVASLFSGMGLGIFAGVSMLGGYSLQTLPTFLYVCIGVTGLGYACWFLSMEYTNANEAGIAFFIKPVLASALAALLLGEVITVNMMLGIVFMLIGSVFTLIPGFLLRRREKRAQAPSE